MRSRTVALAFLILAAFAIAGAPPAAASSQTVTDQVLSSDGGHASFALDSLVFLKITVPQPAVVGIAKVDSAGHRLLVVQVRALPNPAGHTALRSIDAYRSSSQLAFARSEYVERPSLTSLALPPIRSDRFYSQRLTTGLRGAALVGTLVQGRLRRL